MNNNYFKKSGLSLIESVIALAIVAMVVGSLLAVFWQGSMLSRKLDASIISMGLAVEPIELNFNATNTTWPYSGGNTSYNVTLAGNGTANITYNVTFNQTNDTIYGYGGRLRYFNSTVTWVTGNSTSGSKTRSLTISTKKAGY
jgi:type II secretory pathway pseudopilin PulG